MGSAQRSSYPICLLVTVTTEPALAETALHFHLDLARQVHLGKADVSVLVAFHVLQLDQLLGIQLFDEALRHHRPPRGVVPAHVS
jgi:hypothetical protein